MQIFYHLLNKDKVVMYASGFDEGSLSWRSCGEDLH
jgi:hypothetical protein